MFEKHKEAKAEAERNHAVQLREQDAERLLSVATQSHEVLMAAKLEKTFGVASGIVLKKSETAFGTVSGAGLVEPRRAPGQWAGASHGVSFKVAKGVRYRVGQSRGHFVQGEERPTVIDTGTFAVTDQRCVFVGTKRSTEWSYSKLLGFSLDGDALVIFNVSNRQKASGVLYGKEHEAIFDTLIAAAIARFQGRDSHEQLIAEFEQVYREDYAAWQHAAQLARPPDELGSSARGTPFGST